MTKNHINDKNIDIITSRQNPLISGTAKLGDKKHRDADSLFLLDGIKLTLEAASSPLTVEYVIIREDAADAYFDKIKAALPETRAYLAASSAFERVTDERAPQGVVAAVRYSNAVKKTVSGADEVPDGVTLVFDGIQNPDNFGAILRSARAFGIKNVLCGNGCADVYSRKTMRASMGAALHIGTLYTSDLTGVCRDLVATGRRVIATVPSADAKSLFDFTFADGDVIVIGNEGHGISDAVLSEADVNLYIPMVESQESLNAASAAAVILYEVYRQLR